jgi:hypothetical protein
MDITIAESDGVAAFESTANLFFEQILGMDAAAVLFTDESQLSDFSLCGLPEDLDPPRDAPLAAVYDAWDSWVLERLRQQFNVELKTTTIGLLQLFRLIEANTPRSLH